jgi:hypothetical protein
MKLVEFFEASEKFPTTRLRILSTIGLIVATGVVYLMHACKFQHPTTHMCVGWEPSINWIIFLSALAGVDVTQYFVKGFTSVKHAEVAAHVAINSPSAPQEVEEEEPVEDDVIATTDVAELNNNELKG